MSNHLNATPELSGTLWMNLTTSHRWDRPPVGIIRVEQSLFKYIKIENPEPRLRACIWHDGNFVELNEDDSLGEHNCLTAGDCLITVGLDWDQPYGDLLYNIAKKRGVKIFTCCYDLIPVIFPQYCVGDVSKRFSEYFIKLSWASSGVFCISEQTRKDYERFCLSLGAPVRPTKVISLGDNIVIGSTQVSDHIISLASKPFFLFVSTIERRKNHEVLYRAYHIIRRSHPNLELPKLIFVGMQGWGVNDLLKDIELDPLTDGLIIQLNHVSDSELEFLYRKAHACFYPSFYEGWGLPVGEALAMGKAVFASDQGSLPEVGGSLVKYISPWRPEEWASAIIEAIEQPDKIESMEEGTKAEYKPRSWSETARQCISFISDVAGVQASETVRFLPGYDLSNLCGMCHGPSIIANGDGGILMFGPHIALESGTYSISIYGTKEITKLGDLRFDICTSNGNCILAEAEAFSESMGAEDSQLCAFTIELATPVSDFEVRCIVAPCIAVKLSSVILKKLQ
jgi:glycosyltransferase involved in cell wall biosynthesis